MFPQLSNRCRLLYSVLPVSVANELRHRRPIDPKRYDCVTLLFSGIVGFSNYCASNADSEGAMKIVHLLNTIYTAFDVLTDPKRNPNVYKVSALGTCYERHHISVICIIINLL